MAKCCYFSFLQWGTRLYLSFVSQFCFRCCFCFGRSWLSLFTQASTPGQMVRILRVNLWTMKLWRIFSHVRYMPHMWTFRELPGNARSSLDFQIFFDNIGRFCGLLKPLPCQISDGFLQTFAWTTWTVTRFTVKCRKGLAGSWRRGPHRTWAEDIHGYGVYVWTDGCIYKGQWVLSAANRLNRWICHVALTITTNHTHNHSHYVPIVTVPRPTVLMLATVSSSGLLLPAFALCLLKFWIVSLHVSANSRALEFIPKLNCAPWVR